ncbi:hypothetical protein MHU86_11841 [Fragilaria crotonensis]|nr:hypothetical protein MHU86_11841 [Fragilaria crotonensis]
MRDSIIKGEDGYLGPHNRSLNVGDVQSMVFRSTDNGPYWMTPEEQEQTRKDHFVTTVTTKEHTKPQLIELLRQRGIENAKEVRNISGTWQNAQASHSLTRNKMCFKAGKEKQKGWSRFFGSVDGLIPVRIEEPIRLMVKRFDGSTQKDTSLRYLMSNLKDFEGQETMLQLKATEMGIYGSNSKMPL